MMSGSIAKIFVFIVTPFKYLFALQVEEYAKKLQPLLIETSDGLILVPELYAVPREKVCMTQLPNVFIIVVSKKLTESNHRVKLQSLSVRLFPVVLFSSTAAYLRETM